MTVAHPIAEHDVLFAESEDELQAVAGPRLARALAQGSAALVIATEEHRQTIVRAIRAGGMDPVAAAEDGLLIEMDAAATIELLAPRGSFDAEAFDEVVGRVVRGAREQRPVHAFGEMVALLWETGRIADAIELEAAWDALVRETSASLLCAYPGALIDDLATSAEMASICGLHSAVVTEAPFHRRWAVRHDDGAASAARRVVANAMRARGITEDVFYDTLAVLTELVANAVRHGAPPLSIDLTLEPGRALVRVHDRSSVQPTATTGSDSFPVRGLQLVEGVAGQWGIDRDGDGKTVWAELG